ncbi:hypothetical protein AMR72_06095 [Flavobacterium psychrophilum]|nr:hypothetical protein AMR72_06095 [Flavobacterium psychrophilum]
MNQVFLLGLAYEIRNDEFAKLHHTEPKITEAGLSVNKSVKLLKVKMLMELMKTHFVNTQKPTFF